MSYAPIVDLQAAREPVATGAGDPSVQVATRSSWSGNGVLDAAWYHSLSENRRLPESPHAAIACRAVMQLLGFSYATRRDRRQAAAKRLRPAPSYRTLALGLPFATDPPSKSRWGATSCRFKSDLRHSFRPPCAVFASAPVRQVRAKREPASLWLWRIARGSKGSVSPDALTTIILSFIKKNLQKLIKKTIAQQVT